MRMMIPKLLLVVMLGTLWGAGYTIARYAVTNGVAPLGYAYWQSLGPTLLLLLLLKIKGVKIPTTYNYVRFFLACGLLGIALPNTNMYFVAQHLPAGVMAVVINTSALMIYGLALLFKEERFVWMRFFGIIAAIFGVMCLVVPRASLPNVHMLPWIFMALLTPLCFALCALYIIKQQPDHSNVLVLACGMLIVSSIVLTPVVYVAGGFYPLTLHFSLPELAILLEIVISTFGYFILFKLLTTAGAKKSQNKIRTLEYDWHTHLKPKTDSSAVYYSLVGPFVVLSGLFWGWLVFGEQLSNWIYVSALLIIVGLLLVSIGGRSEDSSRI